MPHGDTRATGDRQAVQGDGEGGGTAGCEGRRTATGNWQRYIHITGMARRHLATHSHVTHAASTGALALSLSLSLYLPTSQDLRKPLDNSGTAFGERLLGQTKQSAVR